jgi:hypothetical protein
MAMTNRIKLSLTAGLVVTLLLPSAQAIMPGYPGEALLVPFAVFGDSDADSNQFDTVVYLIAPSTINTDTIPNDYTAPNTTAGGLYTFPGTSQTVHWYFFDQDRSLMTSGNFSVQRDVLTVFSLDDEAPDNLKNEPGYLIFTTAAARSGAAANFAMMGSAYLKLGTKITLPAPGASGEVRRSFVSLPVLPMSDGVDVAGTEPRLRNEVVYGGNVPTQASPLASGLRLSIPDGDRLETVFFDLPIQAGALGDERSTLLVIWLDDDYGFTDVPISLHFGATTCSSMVDLDRGLNLLLVFEDRGGVLRFNSFPFTYGLGTSGMPLLCKPSAYGSVPVGYLRVELPEGNDSGPGLGATSAGAAFSVMLWDVPEDGGVPALAPGVTLIGQDKGKFNPFIIAP